MLKAADLPDDIETLKRLVVESSRAYDSARAQLIAEQLEVERLRFQIAVLKRQQYGRSSEQLDTTIAQLSLTLEDLEASQTSLQQAAPGAPSVQRERPARRALPAELPREEVVHEAPCACPQCGGTLRPAGEDVAEQLEWVPARLKVIRHIRPKLACDRCDTLVQAPAPSRPIARGLAGPGLLAHVLVSKYQDHLPLYRQSQIYARSGIDLDRSTLADWVGGVSHLVQPLVDVLGRYVRDAFKLHVDDTPVPVLCPGRGTTRQGRLWTYVRDDRPAGSTDPPAVWFQYSPDRKGEHPGRHLAEFKGVLQADAYGGFDRLYGQRIQEAACWAHVRRYFYEVHAAHASPIALEALERIKQLYEVEDLVRGRSADERREVRQARAAPQLESLHAWLQSTLPTLSKKSALAVAIRYALTRWAALTRYRDDGRLEIDNNAAERSLRPIALGRKNWLFAGSDDGGERAASIYSLLGTAQLNSLDVEAYMKLLLERLPDYPINRVEELLPWHVADQLQGRVLEAA
jgi:transposase